MAKKKKIESIVLRGIKLEDNSIYTVGSKKPSEGAPEIYKQLGSEKASAPSGVVRNIVGFPMSERSWDTGLYPTSAIFREMGLDPTESEERAKQNKEFVLEPLKNAGLIKLEEQLQDHENWDSEFFLNFMTPIEEGIQFNTGDPRSRLALYAAVISGELAPEGKASKEDREVGVLDEADPVYQHAQYTISSQTVKRTVSEKREYNSNKARGVFFNLMESDKNKLISILNYEGINADKSTDEFSLSQVISKYFESFDNVESFLEVYEKSQKDANFQDELKIMGVLLNEKGMNLLDKDGRTYLLKGKELGTTMKGVARTLANSPELLKEFYNRLEI